MHGNLKEMDSWLNSEPVGAGQVVNGDTPRNRMKRARQTRWGQVRTVQVDNYNRLREKQEADVKVYAETLRELLGVVEQMRKDLRQGKADPNETMDRVGQSMSGLRDLADEAKAVDHTGRMATEMIDKDPAEYEDNQQSRFPVGGRGPEITVAFLRGEEPSPFDGDA